MLTLEGHAEGVSLVAFSADGQRIVTASFLKSQKMSFAIV